MNIQPFGEDALLLSLENEISAEVNNEVIRVYKILKESDLFSFLIPAYSSLTIGIDRTQYTIEEGTQLVKELSGNATIEQQKEQRLITIPVCYEVEFGLDLEEICRSNSLSKNELIDLHCSINYKVFMLGFVAGFAYLGSVPSQLRSSRKVTPRKSVAKGSVGLAGDQTGIYPVEAPGGWQIIGRTPVDMFNTKKEQPNLLYPGDLVKFRSISLEEFKIIQIKEETGIFELEVEHV